MTVPDCQSLMLPVLSIATNEEVRFGDIVGWPADQLGLTPEDRGEPLPSSRQTVFNKRVHWTKTYLSEAGLLESTRRWAFQDYTTWAASPGSKHGNGELPRKRKGLCKWLK